MTTFVDDFAAHLRAQDRSPHTVTAYTGDVAAFFAWLETALGSPTPPAQVTTFDVQKYRDHLVAGDRKPASLNRALASLRTFFTWAVQAGHATTNPAREVNGIKQDPRTPKALTAQEVYRVQRQAAVQRQLARIKAGDEITPTLVDAVRDEALVNLLLYTGLRISECAALRVADVDLGDKDGTVVVRSGKGRKYREIPLHKEARKAVEGYLALRPTDQGEALFVGQRGSLGVRGIRFRITALGQAAGVDKLTPHVLRHTFGSRLLREAKADLVTVAALMGHASVATTAIYTQPTEADKAAAVAGLK